MITTRVLFEGRLHSDRVVCASLFAARDSFRGFPLYVRMAQVFIKQVRKLLPGWQLWLYVDRSVPDDVLKRLEEPHVRLIEFHCAAYWHDGYHDGLFGAFARFLPLFSPRVAKTIFICDIDINDRHIETLTAPKDADMVLGSVQCLHSWMRPSNKVHFTAGSIVSHVTFPRRLLNDFLMHPPDFDIKNHRNTRATRFPYGSDEVFLNTVFYDYLVQRRKRTKLAVFFRLNVETALRSLKYRLPPAEQARLERKSLRDQLLQLRPQWQDNRHRPCIEQYLASPGSHGRWEEMSL